MAKAKPVYVKILGKYFSHYLPLIAAIALSVLAVLFGESSRPKPLPEFPAAISHPKWAADVILGILSFWLWAIITNSHDGRSVASSGQRVLENDKERQEEFAVIFVLTLVTVGLYWGCNTAISGETGMALSTVALLLPIIVLGSPEP